MNKLVGFNYNDGNTSKEYTYARNIQGDITSIYDDEGNYVGGYVYDAWGNHKVLDAEGNEDNNPNSICNRNPFRYRGYYFDVETGLYYCNSRYYDSETGRFISPDIVSILDETMGQINGLNLYMYCGNNPIINVDPSGMLNWKFWEWDCWGVVLDVVCTMTALAVGLILATAAVTALAFTSIPALLIPLIGLATFALGTGLMNYAINFTYALFSDGTSNLEPDSYNNGYLTRWERIDYAMQQTHSTWFSPNTWRYYHEYNAHMYAWIFLQDFYTGDPNSTGLELYAYKAKYANVDANGWDNDWRVNAITIILGILGI